MARLSGLGRRLFFCDRRRPWRMETQSGCDGVVRRDAGPMAGRLRCGRGARGCWAKGVRARGAGVAGGLARDRRGLGAGGVRVDGGAGRGDGELARLPQLQELFQAAENAGENGGDQGIQSRRAPGALLPRGRRAAQAGDLVAEGGCMSFHAFNTN